MILISNNEERISVSAVVAGLRELLAVKFYWWIFDCLFFLWDGTCEVFHLYTISVVARKYFSVTSCPYISKCQDTSYNRVFKLTLIILRKRLWWYEFTNRYDITGAFQTSYSEFSLDDPLVETQQWQYPMSGSPKFFSLMLHRLYTGRKLLDIKIYTPSQVSQCLVD